MSFHAVVQCPAARLTAQLGLSPCTRAPWLQPASARPLTRANTSRPAEPTRPHASPSAAAADRRQGTVEFQVACRYSGFACKLGAGAAALACRAAHPCATVATACACILFCVCCLTSARPACAELRSPSRGVPRSRGCVQQGLVVTKQERRADEEGAGSRVQGGPAGGVSAATEQQAAPAAKQALKSASSCRSTP